MRNSVCACLIACLACVAFAAAATAQKTNKGNSQGGLSDRTVRILASYAWTNIPDEVSKPDGTRVPVKGVGIDKFLLSMEDTKRVVGIADRTAQAKICGLKELSNANEVTLMQQEERSKRWTDNQMAWIFWLHRTVVRLRAFDSDRAIAEIKKLKLDPKAEKKAIADAKRFKKPTCSDEKRDEVRKQIDEFVKSAG